MLLSLALAVVVLAAPGMALLLALGVVRPLWWVGLTVPATIGVATLTASACAVVGVAYGPVPLGLVTLALGVVAGGRARLRLRGHDQGAEWRTACRTAWRSWARPEPLAGLGLVAVGTGLATLAWLVGLGSMASILQEHDMISHGVITAYIDRTGHGAPWQLMPADVLTGDDVSFYPSGMHLVMAVVGQLEGGPVVGVNAVTVAILAIAWTTGSAALAYVAAHRAQLPTATALVVAGVASIVASGLYRPGVSLVQWGGIVANAVTLSLTPGLLAVLVTLPRRRPWGHAAAAGVGCAGMFAVHSSAPITVGVSLAGWWLGEVLLADGRRRLRRQLLPLGVVGVVAALAIAPAIRPLLDVSDTVAGFAPDIAPISLVDALERTVGLDYNNGDPNIDLGQRQLAAAILTLVGAVAVAVRRRGLGALSVWLVWTAIVVAAWTRPGQFPHSLVTNGFYDAQTRVWAHVSLFVPPLAALGVVLATTAAARLASRRIPALRGDARLPRVATSLALAIAVLYTAGPGLQYARTEAGAVRTRYDRPTVIPRFSEDDRAAGEWLRDRVAPGERILNSGNDGSTLLYVDQGLPIVNVSARGSPLEPATYKLMAGFNTYPRDPEIRRMLRDLNVRWVVADSVAPSIFANGAPEAWAAVIDVVPGLTDLDGLPGLRCTFRSGTVSVYSLDLGAIS